MKSNLLNYFSRGFVLADVTFDVFRVVKFLRIGKFSQFIVISFLCFLKMYFIHTMLVMLVVEIERFTARLQILQSYNQYYPQFTLSSCRIVFF